MKQTRREVLRSLAGAAVGTGLISAAEKPQQPVLCVYSGSMMQVGYPELGEIVSQLGFDGVDLTVLPGGHVEPRMAPVDLVRAIESIKGANLSVPIITTSLASPAEPWCRTVLALPARSGVGIFKCAQPRRAAGMQMRRDLFGLAYIGHEYGISMAIPTGEPNAFPLDLAQRLVSELAANGAGLSLSAQLFFGPSALDEETLNGLLPNVKAVTVFDFVVGTDHSYEWKPLGEGSVNFERMFKALAVAHFNGPVTVKRLYAAKDEPGAMAKDAEFIKKHFSVFKHQS